MVQVFSRQRKSIRQSIYPQATSRILLSVLSLRDTLIALRDKILWIGAPIKKSSNLDEKRTYSNHTLYKKPHNEEKRDEVKKGTRVFGRHRVEREIFVFLPLSSHECAKRTASEK